MSGLFRAESLEAAQQKWLGTVSVAQPPALRWGLGLALVIAVGVAALLGLGSYTRKAAVPGVLVPDRGVLRLVPSGAGTVLERHVREGQAVRAGDLLFVLALDQPGRDDGTQAALDRALAAQQRSLQEVAGQQRALAVTRDRALTMRLEALQAEQAQLAAESALHQRRLALARQSLARLQSLRDQAFVADAQLNARQEELLALESQGQALARQVAALERERAALAGERAGLPAERDAAVAQVDSALAELARDGAGLRGVRRVELRAPQDGTVHGLLAVPGQSVAPPSALASLLPAGARLQAELLAPSRTMGFLRAGQQVRLRVEAYPHARYGVLLGEIERVDRMPLAPSDLAGLALPPRDSRAAAEPLYRVVVALRAPPPAWSGRPLVAGLGLLGDVQLERRRLWQWMLEPLLGLQQRL